MARRLKASDPTKATRHKPAEVSVRNIAHPKVWRTAIKVAGGQRELVQVETYTRLTVVIREG